MILLRLIVCASVHLALGHALQLTSREYSVGTKGWCTAVGSPAKTRARVVFFSGSMMVPTGHCQVLASSICTHDAPVTLIPKVGRELDCDSVDSDNASEVLCIRNTPPVPK